jgi:hypothetical protein
MPLIKDDRIAFSLFIVNADSQVKAIQAAKAQLQSEITKFQKLDEANKRLLDPVNTLVGYYQTEFNNIDGNVRTTFVEQDIVDAANRKLRNFFFPNDTTVSVPSLASTFNVWVKVTPFALGYGIGKSYSETYGSTTAETALLTTALGYITSAGSNTNIQNTTGQQCTGTPPDTIVTFPAVQTLKTNLVNTVNSLITVLNAEAAAISAIVDTNVTRQAQNAAALNNINNVIKPALNTWLGYVDFNTAHGQTTCAGFNGYNANLLAPTKLHSTQLAALQLALNNRSTFLTTRTSQLTTNLGTVVQDVSTGEITSSSGFYGQRYGFLNLRLNVFGGSLSKLANIQGSAGAQDAIISSILSTKASYLSILATSLLKAPGHGSNEITLNDASFLSPGDAVFVTAEGQEELQRAVKSVSGQVVVLNDVIPAKFRPAEKARLYKDLT